MSRLLKNPVIMVVMALALLGIGVQLITSPGAFFTSILITIGIATLLILLFRNVIMPRMMGAQNGSAYQKAVKQSKQVHAPQQTVKKPTSNPKNTTSFSKKKQEQKRSSNRPTSRKSSNVKLTVIEGKKNKKKSRALF
ncbi:SA1362 family protein [Salisediminibacterium beveridgei]|uniref:Uncharacterized protein n=1 Tax=Salisediminibacterium beveridgei TaxID=632773 RepID=A0A1D7QUG6_9BACI|nr:SA1362 family protein [Salisediminibacterium beveridgei]AOM82661.1 hypothetical protein BBEV_1296 [Salisediminibacterium beveridgei]